MKTSDRQNHSRHNWKEEEFIFHGCKGSDFFIIEVGVKPGLKKNYNKIRDYKSQKMIVSDYSLDRFYLAVFMVIPCGQSGKSAKRDLSPALIFDFEIIKQGFIEILCRQACVAQIAVEISPVLDTSVIE